MRAQSTISNRQWPCFSNRENKGHPLEERRPAAAHPGSAGGFAEARTATAALAGESTPEAGTQAGRQYERVLLWIDEKLRVVLQAEGYDSGGKLVRRFWINSFKKIDDKWMLKDMEVESFLSTHRTRLRVREVCPPVAR